MAEASDAMIVFAVTDTDDDGAATAGGDDFIGFRADRTAMPKVPFT